MGHNYLFLFLKITLKSNIFGLKNEYKRNNQSISLSRTHIRSRTFAVGILSITTVFAVTVVIAILALVHVNAIDQGTDVRYFLATLRSLINPKSLLWV